MVLYLYFKKKITSRILRTLLISYSYFVFFSEGLKIFHCNLNSKVENLYSTYNWESSQESHCSSNSRELIFPLSSSVFCDLLKLRSVKTYFDVVKFWFEIKSLKELDILVCINIIFLGVCVTKCKCYFGHVHLELGSSAQFMTFFQKNYSDWMKCQGHFSKLTYNKSTIIKMPRFCPKILKSKSISTHPLPLYFVENPYVSLYLLYWSESFEMYLVNVGFFSNLDLNSLL